MNFGPIKGFATLNAFSGLIARRLTIMFVVFGIVATLVTTAVQTYNDYNAEMEQFGVRLDSIRTTHGPSLAASVWRFSEKQIEIELQGLLNIPDIKFVEIRMNDGEVLSVGIKISSNVIVNEIPLIYVEDGKEFPVGTLSVISAKQAINNRITSKALKSLVIFGSWIFLIAGSLYLMFRYLVTRHLDTIANYTSSISFETKMPPLVLERPVSNAGTADELGQVVEAINALQMRLVKSVRDLRNSEEKLRQAHDELEGRVRARTAELSASEKQYSDVLTHLADGAITINTVGIINYVNPMAERMFGYTADEMIGSNVRMLMPEPDHSSHDSYLSNYMKTGDAKIIGIGRQVNGKRKDGSTFPIDLNISESQFDGARTFLGTVRDMSERVKAEEDIIQAKLDAETSNRVKSEFLANISHELRTPLNAIIGFSQALSQNIFGPLNNVKQEEYIDHIHDSGHHLLDLINDILDVSAIEADKLDLDETEVDIDDIVSASLLLVKSRAEEGGVALDNTISGHRPIIRADERRMKQVMVNLLSNAVKFSNAGDQITIGVESKDDGSTSIFVADTGIGMSSEQIALAMEPFGQIHHDDKREREGTGLGLPLTKRLVEAQGGTLLLESEPQIGTTVKVEFPKDKIVVPI